MKKSISLFLTFCVTAGITLFPNSINYTYAYDKVNSAEETLIGDINGDGGIDSLDFAYLRKFWLVKYLNFPAEKKG